MPKNYINNENWVYIFVIGVLFLLILIVGLSIKINEISHELKYLNYEIKRTEGKERRYWIRRKRRLWLSLIPFVKY